ncbi:MAG TPA: hypothetical protein VFM98_24345 [Ramlibacter sp.]|uniref:hypothetical protein n=1 Tax=Ramlibacter sp. TaxID=1917967 RepID=UPI002D803305|nr:hypothetical protein [Ramlibacter sp.]HET8748748.1 hypothetical protein [Ramlibacter sp.]
MDGAVENARLALARLQQQDHALQQEEGRRSTQRQEQQGHAVQSAQRDVFAGAQAARYLARLQAERVAAATVREALQQRVAAARIGCAERQRQLESVQALRETAQRDHAQAQLRREWREADAAWLALTQARRAAALRKVGETR